MFSLISWGLSQAVVSLLEHLELDKRSYRLGLSQVSSSLMLKNVPDVTTWRISFWFHCQCLRLAPSFSYFISFIFVFQQIYGCVLKDTTKRK